MRSVPDPHTLSFEELTVSRQQLRMAVAKAGPVVTDNGNFVIDAPFSEHYMKDPQELLYRLKMSVPATYPSVDEADGVSGDRLTGVLEVGLFCGMAKVAYFGNEDGSIHRRFPDGRSTKWTADQAKSAFAAERVIETTERQVEETGGTRVIGTINGEIKANE